LGTICKGLDGRRRRRRRQRALQYLQDVCIYIILRVPFRGGGSAATAASIMSKTRDAGVLFGAAAAVAADSSLTRHY